MNSEEIREYRKRHGLTRAQLGEIVYQTERAVGSWECGQRAPSKAIIELMLYKLDGIEPDLPAWVSDDQLTLKV